MMIKSFKDLDAWKEGHLLVLMVYKATKLFPKEETFCLVSQIRRAIVSVTSNLAEGFSRQSVKEKIQFYSMSLGSLTEVQNQIEIAYDVGYLPKELYLELEEKVTKVSKIINGLIKATRSRLNP